MSLRFHEGPIMYGKVDEYHRDTGLFWHFGVEGKERDVRGEYILSLRAG
jgi:hypothetical protein